MDLATRASEDTRTSAEACLDLFTPEQRAEALAVTRALVAAGARVFRARPCPPGCRVPGHDWLAQPYHLPSGWQRVNDGRQLGLWQPGDGLGLLGHTPLSFLDDDRGDAPERLAEAGLWPTVWSEASTPSGGRHYGVQPVDCRKQDPLVGFPGLDLQAGTLDGEGVGFVWLSPTVKRSKVDGRWGAYRWVTPPDLVALAAAEPDPVVVKLRQHRTGSGGQKDTTAGRLSSPAPVATGEGRPAPADQVLARVRELAEEVARAREGEGNDTANRVAYQVGQFVGAEQVTAGQAETLLLGALVGWSWRYPADEARLRDTVRRGLADGARNPRPWRDGTPHGTAPTTTRGDTGSDSETAGVPQATPRLPAFADEPPDAVRLFFSAHPRLAALRRHAEEHWVGPWALLGVVLCELAVRLGPHVVLPRVGQRGGTGAWSPSGNVTGPANASASPGVGSLNLCVALVGDSGGGKDLAQSAAAPLLRQDPDTPVWVPTHELGTGQGLDAAYTGEGKDGPVQYNDSALFLVSEVDSLAAHASQSGATLLPTLRKAYSGNRLGALYADRKKRRPVEPHRYRAAVVVNVQPGRSGVFFAEQEVAGGTPQRWLFLPTTDEYTGTLRPPAYHDGDGGDLPPEAPPTLWQDVPGLSPYGLQSTADPVGRKPEWQTPVSLAACDEVTAYHRARRKQRTGEGGSDLTGHELLTRLKVAALLGGLLYGQPAVTDETWRLAWSVLWVSNRTRLACQNTLREQAAKRDQAKGRAQEEREWAAEEARDARDDKLTHSVAKATKDRLRAAGGWVAHGTLKDPLTAKKRRLFDEVVALLVRAGQVEAEERAAPSTPSGVTTYYRLLD